VESYYPQAVKIRKIGRLRYIVFRREIPYNPYPSLFFFLRLRHNSSVSTVLVRRRPTSSDLEHLGIGLPSTSTLISRYLFHCVLFNETRYRIVHDILLNLVLIFASSCHVNAPSHGPPLVSRTTAGLAPCHARAGSTHQQREPPRWARVLETWRPCPSFAWLCGCL
jgi:hypothetical protein